jgi:hypothetical protein
MKSVTLAFVFVVFGLAGILSSDVTEQHRRAVVVSGRSLREGLSDNLMLVFVENKPRLVSADFLNEPPSFFHQSFEAI